MRRLAAVLKDCETKGIHLKVNGQGLEVRGALESVSGLREELTYHKPNVLHYLRTGRCHHELEPKECAVCSGQAKRLIEGGMT